MLDHAVDLLRSGSWLDAVRLRRIGLVLAIAYAASWAYLLSGEGHLDPTGRAVGADFAAFYGVSRALLDGSSAALLYSPRALNQLIGDLTGGDPYVWLYPPTSLLPYWSIAKLPYFTALALWNAVWLAAYLVVIWHVLPARFALWAAIVSPAVYCCTLHGHNGLLNAVLIGSAFLLMPSRPLAAGALMGAAAVIKPHLVLLVPVALLSARRWGSLGAMAAIVTLLGLASAVALGPDVWEAFLASAHLSRAMLELEGVPYAKMASVFSAARLLGLPNAAAYVAQGAAAAGSLGLTAWAWSRPRAYEHQVSVLLLAGVLATPYVYDYDLPAMGVGLLFWARAATRDGWCTWEKSAIFAAWLVPLLTRPIAMATRLGMLPLVLLAAVMLVARRTAGGGAAPGRAVVAVGSIRGRAP